MTDTLAARLRQTTQADLDAVIEMETDPRHAPFIRQWPRNHHEKALMDNHYGHYIIEDRDKTISGYVILTGLDNPDQSIEFKRIVIRKKEMGLGTQAVKLVQEKAFAELGCHRLWLEVLPANTRARRVYEKCGFIKEGVHRGSLKMNNRFHSLDVMSILRTEYLAMSA